MIIKNDKLTTDTFNHYFADIAKTQFQLQIEEASKF